MPSYGGKRMRNGKRPRGGRNSPGPGTRLSASANPPAVAGRAGCAADNWDAANSVVANGVSASIPGRGPTLTRRRRMRFVTSSAPAPSNGGHQPVGSGSVGTCSQSRRSTPGFQYSSVTAPGARGNWPCLEPGGRPALTAWRSSRCFLGAVVLGAVLGWKDLRVRRAPTSSGVSAKRLYIAAHGPVHRETGGFRAPILGPPCRGSTDAEP